MPWRKILRIIYPTDLITFAYTLITTIFIIFGAFRLPGFMTHLIMRVVFVAIVSLLIYLDYKSPNRIIRFLRHFYPLMLLAYFYPETDYLNNVFFPNLDPWVANLEITIFGGQPSVWFSQYLPWKWFNELMCFGYFSYYFIILGVCLWVYKKSYHFFSYTIFITTMSFYLYYIIFILIPVAGPQFYLTPPDNFLPDAYIFREAIKFVHSLGEGPTAAFPSSHVGITCILIYISSKYAKPLLKWIVPISILLILSTVYIKAHYVIDVIAGFLTVPTLYWLSSKTYHFITHGLSQENKIHAFFHIVKPKVIKIYHKLFKK